MHAEREQQRARSSSADSPRSRSVRPGARRRRRRSTPRRRGGPSAVLGPGRAMPGGDRERAGHRPGERDRARVLVDDEHDPDRSRLPGSAARRGRRRPGRPRRVCGGRCGSWSPSCEPIARYIDRHRIRYARRNMNLAHNMLCSSGWWSRRVEDEARPVGRWRAVDLDGDVLEIGPGFGATTRVLAPRGGFADRRRAGRGLLQEAALGDRRPGHRRSGRRDRDAVRGRRVLGRAVLHDAPSRPRARGCRTGCSRGRAECCAPGGWFAGTDSVGTGALFKLIHVGDTLVPIDPDELPSRLTAAGFEPGVDRVERSFRFRARKPA